MLEFDGRIRLFVAILHDHRRVERYAPLGGFAFGHSSRTGHHDGVLRNDERLVLRRADYLPADKREGLGIRSIEERKETVQAEVAEKSNGSEPEQPKLIEVGTKPVTHAADAPLCYSCGSKMQPAGSCYVCTSCGSTSGCS